MQELDDNSLLREYAENNSEEAFAALVARHINKVYSVALRHTRNPSEAEEITQAVFVILAKKARHLGAKVVISGWLYQTARLTSVTYLRSEIRRARREQEAHTMQTILNEPDEAWAQMAPLLDAAMAALNETDRHAVVLKFFDGKSTREVSEALGATEDAAKKRLSRALEKLQRFFAKRGVSSTTAIIAGAISNNSVQVAPVTLAKSVTALAMAHGVNAGASTLTLVKGALKVMAWTKAKTAVMVGIGVLLLATCATPHVWYYHVGSDAWRHRFESVYRLRNGEVLKNIRPPFIPERLTFYQKEMIPIQVQYIPNGGDFYIISQDKQGQLSFGPVLFAGGSRRIQLQDLLHLFGFKPYEIEGPNQLMNLTISGDWTMREGLSTNELLSAMEPILWKATKHHIVFENRTVERDVIVATGNHFSLQPGTLIQIYAKSQHDTYSYNGGGNLNMLLDELATRLKIRVVDETTIDPQSPETRDLTWTYHQDSDATNMKKRQAELTDDVLKNLADQTGLVFTHEQRPEPVWFVSEK